MSDPILPREVPEKFLVAFSFAGEQRELVRSIAEAVEARLGRSNVFLDEWYEAWIAGSDADILLQNIYSRCAVAVVCVSERYSGKPWTLAEWSAVRARVNKARASANDKDRQGVLPVRVGDGDIQGVFLDTWMVPDVRLHERSLDKTVELIVNRLQSAAPEIQPAAEQPSRPPWPNEHTPFDHGLADRVKKEWPAIQKLMTAGSDRRILIFKGPSGFSKSALLNAAARYAKILGVPTTKVDFKDTQFLRQTNILEKVRLDLGAIMPGFAAAEEPNPWKLLQALHHLDSPALILLDTYEKITETKELVEWIEIQLLAEVEQSTQLRFLIAGQKVPERAGLWSDLAKEIELDKIDDQQVWKEWAQQKNPQMDDKYVEGIVLGLDGMPAAISTALTRIAGKLTSAD